MWFFRKKNERKMVLPEEGFTIIQYSDKGLPGFGAINFNLKGFGNKEFFGWFCSLIIQYDNVRPDGLPVEEEMTATRDFEEKVCEMITGNDKRHPNVLFLGDLTWNGTRQMMWRVSDPEPVHALLGNIINRGDYPRHFSYEIVKDPEWEQTAFILGSW